MTRTLALALLLLAGGVARADGYVESQYRLSTLLSLTWEAGVPAGSLRDYVGAPSGGLRDLADAISYRGGQFEVRFGVARHLSLGLATSWNWFAHNFSRLAVDYQNATVTGPAYRRLQFFTLRATGHWYLTDGPVQPYLGAGAGGVWSGGYKSVADLATSSSSFDFAADPQVGLLVTVGAGLALHVQARYQLTLSSLADVKKARWAGVEVGVAVY